MPTVAGARISHTTNVPVAEWRWQSMIQAFVYAKDPKTGKEYIFATQARMTGPKDVEDAMWHRHLLTGDKLTYLDTMTAKGFGHVQSFHVRISALGQPWIWAGINQYDRKGKKVAVKLARFKYRKSTTIGRGTADVDYISTGAGNNVTAVSCPPWKIVIRRAKALSDVYEELNEKDLIAGKYRPGRKFTRLKFSTYQGACATGSAVWVVTGLTDRTQTIAQHDWTAKSAGRLDISHLNSPTGPNTSDEPEGVGIVRGVLHVGKRYNSTQRRIYSLFALRW